MNTDHDSMYHAATVQGVAVEVDGSEVEVVIAFGCDSWLQFQL